MSTELDELIHTTKVAGDDGSEVVEAPSTTVTSIKTEESEKDVVATPPKTPKSNKKRKGGASGETEATSSPSSAKKTKATPSKKAASKSTFFPTKPEDLAADDRLIWDLVQAGKKWPEITKALEALDGQKRGGSTARMRYQRYIEPAMSHVKEDDHDIMMKVVAKVDGDIKQAKHDLDQKRWTMVAEGMKDKGTEVYPAKAVEKAYKQVSTAQATVEVQDEETEE